MSSKIFKNWFLALAAGVLLIIVAVLVFIYPRSVVDVIQFLLGVLLVAVGLTSLLSLFFSHREGGKAFTIVYGLANIALGATFFFFPAWLIVLIGTGAIVNGIGVIAESVYQKGAKEGASWLGIGAIGALLVVAGVFALVYRSQVSAFLGYGVGTLLLLVAIVLIIIALVQRKK